MRKQGLQLSQVKGFTLIELMIVITIIAVLTSLALPAYQDFTIRAKVTEGLSISSAVKTAVAIECMTSPNLNFTDLSALGYTAPPSSQYVAGVVATTVLSGSCLLPTIAFKTTNTGADVEPVVIVQGILTGGRMAWYCFLVEGEARHLPATCREPWPLGVLPIGPIAP